MKKLFTLIMCMAGLSTSACTGGDRPITMEELPAAARQFVSRHFSDVKVAYVAEDAEVFSKTYDVGFVNGDKIEFDKAGMWTDVDCSYTAVPDTVIPLPIDEYLGRNYPNAVVKKIERKKRGYEVKLGNGFEIEFDQQYRVRKIDD